MLHCFPIILNSLSVFSQRAQSGLRRTERRFLQDTPIIMQIPFNGD